MMDQETIDVLNLVKQMQDEMNAQRSFMVKQIDDIKGLVDKRVSHEELSLRLDHFKSEVTHMQSTITIISDSLNRAEATIMRRIDQLADQQSQLQEQLMERQKQSLQRVIALQATILVAILTAVISIAINFITHTH